MGRKSMRDRGLHPKAASSSSEEHNGENPCFVDFGNFWRNTAANFTSCDPPYNRTTAPSFRSKSGSVYWDVNQTYVVRYSNHWSGQYGVNTVVDCHWTIDIVQAHKKEYLYGFCTYRDFVQRKATNRRPKRFQAQGFGGSSTVGSSS